MGICNKAHFWMNWAEGIVDVLGPDAGFWSESSAIPFLPRLLLNLLRSSSFLLFTHRNGKWISINMTSLCISQTQPTANSELALWSVMSDFSLLKCVITSWDVWPIKQHLHHNWGVSETGFNYSPAWGVWCLLTAWWDFWKGGTSPHLA